MNVQQIIDRARRMTYTNNQQYNDIQAVEDFNIIYREICNKIISEVNEWFFRDIFTTDLVLWQNEYVLPNIVRKLEEVIINWYKATSLELYSWKRTAEDYNNYQSQLNPVYEIKDKSIFIFPAPTENIIWWLKLKWLLLPDKLIKTDTEDKILINEEFHYIISEWMKQFCYQARWKIQEKNDAINEYKMKLSEMIDLLTDRESVPTTWLLPNLKYYE